MNRNNINENILHGKPSNGSLNKIGYKRKNDYFGSLKWTEAFSTFVNTANVSIAKRMVMFDGDRDGEKK